MKKLLTLALGLVFVAGVASAQVNTNFFTFDSYDDMFDHNNNWSPISYPGGIGNVPSPGNLDVGGEVFDFEGIFVRSDASQIYIGITNTSGWSVWAQGREWWMGDLFITTNTGNLFAIDVNANIDADGYDSDLWMITESDYSMIPDLPGGYGHNPTIRDAAGPFEVTGGQQIDGVVESYLTFMGNVESDPMYAGQTGTHFYEFAFDKELLGDYNSFSLSMTMRCGNDKIEYNPIPEPTTIALFGLGLLGAGIMRRRNK